MTNYKSKPVKQAEETTVVPNSIPFDFIPLDAEAIPEPQFRRFVQAFKTGDISEPEFQLIQADLKRATRMRKTAFLAGLSENASSASSREQAIISMILPCAVIGVRSRPGRKQGGVVTGQQKQHDAKQTEARIHALATTLLETKEKREVSGIIAERLKLKRATVLRHLAAHPSGLWKKGKTS